MIRVRLDLETISRTSSRDSNEQADLRVHISKDLAEYHATVTDTVNQNIGKVDQRISRIEQLLMAQATVIAKSQYPDSMLKSQQTAVALRQRAQSDGFPMDAEKSTLASQVVGIRVKKNVGPSCRPGCLCNCHIERKSNTSGHFDRVVGRLFVGYSGLPLLNSSCDSATCQRSQTPYISAEYWFPLGFCWSQIIRLELGYQPNIGPQWQLNTLRRVTDSAQCVKYALGGNIDGLKSLFQQGMASPKDVSSTRGYSLLRVSGRI